MRQRVEVIVRHHLGHARSARCEIYKHYIAVFGGLLSLGADKFRARLVHSLMEIQPLTVFRRAGGYKQLKSGAVRRRLLHSVGNISVGGAYYAFYIRHVAAVDYILGSQ